MARRNRTTLNSGTDATKYADPEPAQDHVNQNSAGQDGGPHVGLADREPNADSELNETSGPRCTGMSADAAADDIPELCDQLSLVPVTHPFAGPLLKAAQSVLNIYDGEFGISDEHYLPVIEARRILYGANDGFVVAHTASEARRLIQLGKIVTDEDGDGDIFRRPVPLSSLENELGAGLRFLGQLVLNMRELPTKSTIIETTGDSVMRPAQPVTEVGVVQPRTEPVPPVLNPEVVALTVAKFAGRWDYCKRQIETYIRHGLPIHGEGRERRILIAEGDEWMRLYRDPLARRASETAQRHATPKKRGPGNAGA